MTTFADAKKRLLRIVEDEITTTVGGDVRGAKYDEFLLLDAISAGLSAIVNRLWKSAKYTITTDGTVFTLPSDLIDIEAVKENTQNILLPRQNMTAGQSFVDRSGNAWYQFPEGSITFANPILANSVDIFYSASWEKPVLDADVMSVPDVALTAVLYFAASYCLLTESSGAARLRQYATRVDSGVPTDNPLFDQSNLFMRRYEIELQRIPMKQKGSY